MAKFDELPWMARFGIMLAIALVGGFALYYVVLIPKFKENDKVRVQLTEKQAENNRLKDVEKDLDKLRIQLAQLQTQLELQKKIVPSDKDADEFIKLLHDNAAGAGIEIRRYTAMPTSNKEFYIQVPFQIDIDGPYYSVLNFFDRLAKAERIVNVDNLQMSNIKETGPSRIRSTYAFAPGESVVASCTAMTFFSRDLQPTAPATPAPSKR
jgi:type IV pilus assembly protein PilO